MTKNVVPVGSDRTVVRREANPFSLLQQEIDRLFEGFGRSFPAFGPAATTLPSMDVSESDNAIEIVAELPGLEKKDVELSLADNLLTIRGEKKNEREEKNKDYHLVERSFGSFSRAVEVSPETVYEARRLLRLGPIAAEAFIPANRPEPVDAAARR